MKKLDVEEYINALDDFLGRYICPNCGADMRGNYEQ